MSKEIKVKFDAEVKSLADKLDKAEKMVTSSTKKMENASKKLSSSFSSIAKGVLFSAAIKETVDFAKKAVELAGKFDGVEQAFNKLNRPDLLLELRKATQNTVSDLELMQTAVKAENFRVNLSELPKLLEFARKRAAATGEDVNYLVESIITGLGRKSPQILDNLGISMSELNEEVKKTGDFTQAVGTIVDRELTKMGDVSLTAKDNMAQLNAEIENAQVIAGQKLAPVFTQINSLIQKAIAGWSIFLGSLGDTSSQMKVNQLALKEYYNSVKDYSKQQIKDEKLALKSLMEIQNQKVISADVGSKEREIAQLLFDVYYEQYLILEDMNAAKKRFAEKTNNSFADEEKKKMKELKNSVISYGSEIDKYIANAQKEIEESQKTRGEASLSYGTQYEEYIARQTELEKQKANEVHNQRLNEVSQLGSALQNAFARSGDTLLSKMVGVLQVAIQVAQAVQMMNVGTGGPLGIVSAALGIFGIGFATGGTLTNYGNSISVNRNIPSFATGGNFTVPKGYDNDSFPIMVQSGERVSVTPANTVGNSERLLAQLINRVDALNMNLVNKKMSVHVVNNSPDVRTKIQNEEKVKKFMRKENTIE